ncbi:MAG: hypothetical protein ACRDUA_23990, partial [Micromonosporaceae bacterium]
HPPPGRSGAPIHGRVFLRADATRSQTHCNGLTLDELNQLEAIDEQLHELEDTDRIDYQWRFTATVLNEFERLRSENPLRYPDHLTVTVRFTDNHADFNDLTDAWDHGIAGHLYDHARVNTPLPGSDTKPDWTPGQAHALQLLNAGHWPHLRLPQLAHHGLPTNHPERKDSQP